MFCICNYPCTLFCQIGKNFNFVIWQETIHTTHLLKFLDKMYQYEMDPTRTVGTTEWTQDGGRTDGQTGRQMDGGSKANIPPTTSLYNKSSSISLTCRKTFFFKLGLLLLMYQHIVFIVFTHIHLYLSFYYISNSVLYLQLPLYSLLPYT